MSEETSNPKDSEVEKVIAIAPGCTAILVPSKGEKAAKVDAVLHPIGFQLKDEITTLWTHISTYALLLVTFAPDVYDQAIRSGVLNADKIPPGIAWFIQLCGLIGFISKMVKQKATPPTTP